MGSVTRRLSEVSQPTCCRQNGHLNPDGICLGFFLQPVTAGSEKSHLHCPKALMRSECFHFHSSTVCYYVGQEISPFTASGTVAQDGWWLVLSRTTDLNPDLCSQVLRKLSHPGDWPGSPCHLLPGLCPFSLEGRPACPEPWPALRRSGGGCGAGCGPPATWLGGCLRGMRACISVRSPSLPLWLPSSFRFLLNNSLLTSLAVSLSDP